MAMSERVAVVVSTYNNPRFLGLALTALSNQSEKSFEIFIADDGSAEETKDKVHNLQTRLEQPVHYFWQEDKGFRKARIHNEVFRHLKGFRYTICMDGDTFPHYRFIEDHLILQREEERRLVMGRRINLGPQFTDTLNEVNVLERNRGLTWALFGSFVSGDTPHITGSIRIANPKLRSLLGRSQVLDLIGSNFSVPTELLFEVNGYDENFETYWGEDGDLFIRLRNAGAQLVGVKSFAIQYHMYHPPKAFTPEQEATYRKMLANTEYRRCARGIE